MAVECVQAMHWKREELEHQIDREPELGLALIQEFVTNMRELQGRIVAMSTCKAPERVMLSLLQLARTMGELQPNGSVMTGRLTHRIIAEHVGTTRAIVTAQLNRLRRLGLITYSRRYFKVYCDAIEQFLRDEAAGAHAQDR